MSYRESHATSNYGQKYAASYKSGYNYYQWEKSESPLLREILQNLKICTQMRYLDFACGTGRILGVGENVFQDSTGFDISRTMLDQASLVLQNSKLVQIDISNESIDDSFDIITSFRFFTNAERELSLLVLRALHGSLSSNGKLVINFHRNDSGLLSRISRLRGVKPTPGGPRFRDYKYAEQLLVDSGFKIESDYWYSFAPKFSKYPDWLLNILFGPVEKILSYLPKSMKCWSQCFILVCSKE